MKYAALRKRVALGACLGLSGFTINCGGDAETPITCGAGTVKTGNQCAVVEENSAIAVTVTSLEVDHAPGSDIYRTHPLKVKIGLTSIGEKSLVALTYGLVPATPQPDGYSGCYLGAEDAVLTGTGDEQVFESDTFVYSNCKPGLEYNLYVSLDSTGGAPPIENNLVQFTDANKGAPETSQCKATTPTGDTVDCNMRFTVKESAGINYRLVEAIPLSNVGVQYVKPPATSGAPLEAIAIPEPFLRANWVVSTNGRDIADPDAEKRDQPLNIRYYVRALQDKDNVGWKLLNFGPETCIAGQKVNDPLDPPEFKDRVCPGNGLYNPTHRVVHDFRAGLKYSASNNLYLVDEIDRVINGEWSTEEDFLIQSCLETASAEYADPVYGGSDGKQDNCQVFPVRIVRALKPAGAATALNFDYNWTKDFGTQSLIKMTAVLDTQNHLSATEGALMRNKIFGQTGSDLIKALNLVLVDGRANATSTSSKSNIDASFSMMGNQLYSFQKEFSNEYAWSQTWSITKEFPFKFSKSFLIASVDFDFSVTGTASVTPSLTVGFKPMPGPAPLDKATAHAYVKGVVTPKAKLSSKFDLTVKIRTWAADADLAVKGNTTLIDVSAPLKANLGFGTISSKAFLADGDVTFGADFAPLTATIDAQVAYASSGAKKLGVDVGKLYNLVSVDGGEVRAYSFIPQQKKTSCIGDWSGLTCAYP